MYIHLNVSKQMTDIIFLLLHSNTWTNLTVYKRMSLGSFKKNVISKMSLQIMYLIYF